MGKGRKPIGGDWLQFETDKTSPTKVRDCLLIAVLSLAGAREGAERAGDRALVRRIADIQSEIDGYARFGRDASETIAVQLDRAREFQEHFAAGVAIIDQAREGLEFIAQIASPRDLRPTQERFREISIMARLMLGPLVTMRTSEAAREREMADVIAEHVSDA